VKIINVPTGKILILRGEAGELECLSLGDYGKEKNIKADFLGLSREINGVPSGEVMPLKNKWVITISSQYGCSMNCNFCDVPKVGKGRNASLKDLDRQLVSAILSQPCTETDRLNIHYARMGEPTFNPDILKHAHPSELARTARKYINAKIIHPVLSTMLPKNNRFLKDFLRYWCSMKNNDYKGDAGLQFSINSTSDEQRSRMFSNNSLPLEEIALIGLNLPVPVGRKYALNFALADGYEIDADRLARLFNTNKFMVKITPMHMTKRCKEFEIKTSLGYEYYTPYKKAELDLKASGFDVLVFVPSLEEDDGLITCGNAVLSGSMPYQAAGATRK
jgi:23S rRNA (adenine2503-C2)-methyltransferase